MLPGSTGVLAYPVTDRTYGPHWPVALFRRDGYSGASPSPSAARAGGGVPTRRFSESSRGVRPGGGWPAGSSLRFSSRSAATSSLSHPSLRWGFLCGSRGGIDARRQLCRPPATLCCRGRYCAVRKIGDSPSRTAQSGGESEEGRRAAPLGRVPAPQAWVRGEGRAVACPDASARAFLANY
jgi:hypothetical protein